MLDKVQAKELLIKELAESSHKSIEEFNQIYVVLEASRAAFFSAHPK